MKIFTAFLQSEHKYAIPDYSFWEYYLKNGITEAGFQWTECPGVDWALGLVPKNKDDQAKWKEVTWERTVDWLKKHPVDLFISYLYPQMIDTSAIKEIQKFGIPCINFFCDHLREFKSVPREFEVFNLNWVPEYKAVKWYKEVNYPFINLPMPMWVEPKYRSLNKETKSQITFIGSKDIQRKLLFEKLIGLDPTLPLAIYGNGWEELNVQNPNPAEPDYTFDKKLVFNLRLIKRQGILPYLRKIKYRNINSEISDTLFSKTHKILSFEDYISYTKESKITLGVSRYPSYRYPLSKPGTYSRLRDIEAPMLGACYLTEYTEGLGELYDLGSEINVYNDLDELLSKAKELLNNSQKRLQLRVNGQRKALNDHSIPTSLNKIKAFIFQ